MSGIKIFAPASVANVACGFDVLGFAIEGLGDEIIVKKSNKPGVHISKITGDGGRLPLEAEKNTAGVAALAAYRYALSEGMIDADLGIDLELHKKMPFGSGLGSSSASAVAGAMVINEFLKHPLEKKELLPFAMEGEVLASGSWHADNVAPAMLGGMVLIRDSKNLDIHRLPIPKGLFAVVVYPHLQVNTKEARGILSPTVSLKDAVTQTGNLGAFIIGMYQADFGLIGRSLQDALIEHQRAHLIPHFYTVKEAALENGALGCSISGSGPSIFALCSNSLAAENVGAAMQKVFLNNKIKSNLYISKINQEGACRL